VQQQFYHLQIVGPPKPAGTEQKALHDRHVDICGVSMIRVVIFARYFLNKTVFMGMVTGQQHGSQQGKESHWIR